MSQAVDLKNQGNKAFAAGDFPKAIVLYSEAIDLDSTQPAFFTNRAQVCMLPRQSYNATFMIV